MGVLAILLFCLSLEVLKHPLPPNFLMEYLLVKFFSFLIFLYLLNVFIRMWQKSTGSSPDNVSTSKESSLSCRSSKKYIDFKYNLPNCFLALFSLHYIWSLSLLLLLHVNFPSDFLGLPLRPLLKILKIVYLLIRLET